MSHIIIPGQPVQTNSRNELNPEVLLLLLESLLGAQVQPALSVEEKPRRKIGFQVPTPEVEEENGRLAL
jgi:hypothetical protein